MIKYIILNIKYLQSYIILYNILYIKYKYINNIFILNKLYNCIYFINYIYFNSNGKIKKYLIIN